MIHEDVSVLPRYGARLAKELRSLQALIEHLKVKLDEGLEAIISEALQLLVQDNETCERLTTLFQQAQSETDARSLQDLLTGLQVSLGGLEQSSESDKIRIMTMHQAKGLTARAVILAGVEDEFLPGRSANTPREDDERRLLYVSLTRAKEFLFMTHCEGRREQQRRMGRTQDQSGQLRRNLTRVLQDAPIPSENGVIFVNRLLS
jgi:DNA helicase-2/ATP-dependent DNA helicase PcrA